MVNVVESASITTIFSEPRPWSLVRQYLFGLFICSFCDRLKPHSCSARGDLILGTILLSETKTRPGVKVSLFLAISYAPVYYWVMGNLPTLFNSGSLPCLVDGDPNWVRNFAVAEILVGPGRVVLMGTCPCMAFLFCSFLTPLSQITNIQQLMLREPPRFTNVTGFLLFSLAQWTNDINDHQWHSAVAVASSS